MVKNLYFHMNTYSIYIYMYNQPALYSPHL